MKKLLFEILKLHNKIKGATMSTLETYTKGGSFLIQESSPENTFTPEDFTEQHKMISQTANEFVEKEVLPKIEEIEEQNWEVTLSLMRKAGEIGLLAVDIPEEYGGLGLDKTSSMLVAEEIGKASSFAVTHGAHTGIGTLPIVYFGTEEQKKKYLPKFATGELISSYALTEPNAGSDALSIRTTATLSPDGKYYILNGNKIFITNAGIADVYITFAKINGEHFTGFILEKNFEGISLGKEEKKMGIKGSSTRALNLDNVKVPIENVLGEIGKGHKIAFNILNIGRFKLGAAVIGGAKAVITESVKYAKQRKQFGKSISEFGLIKHKIGEMAIRTFVGESMVYRTAGLIDNILSGIDKSDPKANELALKGIEEYAVECSIIKVYASEILDYVVDEAVQIFGGYGYIEEYPVARAYRDSRINRIFEGTNEINRLVITGMLLKRAMKGELPLIPAAQKLTDEIMGIGVQEEEATGIFAEEKKLLKSAKKAGLFVAGLAVQKYMTKLEDEEEIIGRISDIIMEIYAMESAILRVEKMLARGGKNKTDIYIDIVKAFVNDSIIRVETYAKELLSAIAEGDMLRTYLTALRRLIKHIPINTISLRRKIADHLIEMERYAL
ncbi:butyryl-CoA dehydrogenase [Candidatus Kryptonium thompsonii]|uniref:Butyryl-CoA dehydrogenase n=2 Tax=Candidatus Kryptonium thompsonii TaxID=1633631 RepID=A0A0P1P559_9BACT|nr:butyryl-CoA dehydrogenase [Candidatus Kryptonium thompsoni]CUS83257.1 butyryl-CoA dehydrogenase [Candidatus Kryptonium thompsoni]CUS84693.1 butyryl-CoA dehydrogenase [Candidatus Kryptonium thompsoni]CUS87011.1 butyryl-CoA dehydrogenase [Candidatus Kryptonium thompsoni]CUS87016.1 butyryl-CoA dehydrogenase [Candidatus Kryptonium thompsoni]